jgi:subtilase family serine protease
MPGSSRIELDVSLRPRDPVKLAAFATAVSTPGSPLYRHYLRPGAFGATFGPTASTVRATAEALERLGLRVDSVSGNRLLVKVSAPVSVIDRAFSTTLVRYRLRGGRVVFSNQSAPRLPIAVAGAVQAVTGLSDMSLLHPTGLARPTAHGRPAAGARLFRSPVTGGPMPCVEASDAAQRTGVYTANELASAYGFSGLYAGGDVGAGVTVAVVELEPDLPSDIAAYQSCYGTSATVNYVEVDSGAGSGPGSGEAALDIEDVIGLVPEAKVDVYQGPNTSTGPLDVYNAVVAQDKAKVISTSWGDCEAQDGGSTFVAAEANLFEQAAVQGQTVLASAGDEGSTDCTAGNLASQSLAVDDPGSQPYVTSVGGTSLTALGPPPEESVWNDKSGASGNAGGGGVSSNWAMPAYEADAPATVAVIKISSSGRPCRAPTGYCREVPDVSADADPDTGYLVYYASGGGWTPFGGTSASTPLWASLVALADAWPACGGRPVGFLNPSLYSIAGGSAGKSAFNDVTLGSNDMFPGSGHYPATRGYDMASGLGTPDAFNPAGKGLVDQLCALDASRASYASPTRSAVIAEHLTVRAVGTAYTTVTVTLRTALGIPVAGKRVILVGTTATTAAKSKLASRITPSSMISSARGVAVFDVSDTVVQQVVYRATDLTDGLLLERSATVRFVKP